MMEMTFRY